MAMGLGIRMGLGPRRVGAPFTPASLSPSAWYDASDTSTLFQDSAGTTPYSTPNDPLGKANDKSGAGRHMTQATSSARMLVTSTGGGLGFKADGVDDGLYTASGQTWPALCDVFFVIANPDNDTLGVTFNNAPAYGDPYCLAYSSGSGVLHTSIATPGSLFVNGVASDGTQGDLYTKLGSTNNKVVEIRSIDLATFGIIGLAAYTGFVAALRYHEILIYPALSAGNRTLVRDYLTTKWGVA